MLSFTEPIPAASGGEKEISSPGSWPVQLRGGFEPLSTG
jgi:hypothetical protein